MKICRKFGLSYYTIELTKEESIKWKEAAKLDKFDKRIARREIFDEAWLRTKFGGAKGALKALKALDKDLKKF